MNLYFLLELLDGGELLEQLISEGRQMALHEDLARFYLADVVNAVEYMHASHILHRDLKPENMVVCKGDGHIRLIDFGTAKNLANTALNGPNFVGTPEYMPPEVIDNKEATTASDLWAVGCIMYQLLTGETPFSGGSAYLTFLRVQDGSVHVPEFISEDARDLIVRLLQPDPMSRPDIHQIKGEGSRTLGHTTVHTLTGFGSWLTVHSSPLFQGSRLREPHDGYQTQRSVLRRARAVHACEGPRAVREGSPAHIALDRVWTNRHDPGQDFCA